MSNPKQLMKTLTGIEDINNWVQQHTVVIDGQKNIIVPYSVDEMIGTKNQTSSLDDDLRNIDKHMSGVISGDILVGHSAKSDRLSAPRNINLSGDATGHVSFDGSTDVTIPVVISDNSHQHTIDNVTGLQNALDQKLTIEHDHKKWSGFKAISAGGYTVNATMPEDTLNLVAGANIVLNTNDKEKTVTLSAVMTEVEAETSTTLRGIKVQYDANRTQNEQYIPVVSYSLPLEIGPNIDFHLSGSKKDFDGRLLVNAAGALHYTIDGTQTYKVFHEGNSGPQSGLDADTVDGKHASSFATHDHHHDDRYLSGTNGEMTTDLILSNGKFLKGRKKDKTSHQLLGISGGDVVDFGNSELPMTIWSKGNPTIGIGSSKKAIYHEGNKPSWLRDILDIPTQFTPTAHTHTSSEITDATSESIANTIVKRNGTGDISVSRLLAKSTMQVGQDVARLEFSNSSVDFMKDGINSITSYGRNSSLTFHVGELSVADALTLDSSGEASFGGNVSIRGLLTLDGGVSVNGSMTVNDKAYFKNGIDATGHAELKGTVAARGGMTTPSVDMGDYMKLSTGHDASGLSKKNNSNIDTWWGFSVSNLCPNMGVGVGVPAFSVDARNGNTYSAGTMYSNTNKRVYHEGNFIFSTSDSPSGGVNGDLWFTYEA